MSIILFFVILLVLVLVHEFGHFIVAKKSGIRVDEFGFGFPPKLFSKKWGETVYSFNALPFGGFVKIFGESPDDESISGPDAARSFINKPRYIQAAVLFAGVFANFLLAWLLLSVGFMSGLPTSAGSLSSGARLSDVNLVITSVLKNSPAESAGFQIGDKIISASDGNAVTANPSTEAFQNLIKQESNKTVEVNIIRGAEAKTLAVTPAPDFVGGNPGIGVSLDEIGILKLPFFQALWEGLKNAGSLTYSTAVSLVMLIKNIFIGQANFSSITGPVGIVGIVGDAYHFGLIYLMSFAALISINLAVINLIPFPALDGGRLLFILIEKIKGSPIKPKVANVLNTVGFFLLIALMAVVTYHDIAKLL